MYLFWQCCSSAILARRIVSAIAFSSEPTHSVSQAFLDRLQPKVKNITHYRKFTYFYGNFGWCMTPYAQQRFSCVYVADFSGHMGCTL